MGFPLSSGETSNLHLLVVEDDEGLQRQLKWSLDDYNVILAGKRDEAIAAVRRYQPHVVTLDLGLPPDPANASEGFSTLSEILDLSPLTKVIVITGNDHRENAVKAISMGAFDFYQKPVDPDVLKIIIDRAFRVFHLEQENIALQEQASRSPLDGLISNYDGMLKVCRMIEKIAPTDVSTLLIGESGTGKEILANALHRLGTRRDEKFVAINCAAIPDNLLESELFGHEKGAFTGANSRVIGKIELANGGTLFLDEIGDLPLNLQAKLLRFLQERVIERIGGRNLIEVDVRIVSATHRNIQSMIADETFREDLYYRLSEVVINIPPLRDRTGDAILLARTFLEKFNAAYKKKIKSFTQPAVTAIESYQWPGNVRELEGIVKRAVIMSENNKIDSQDLGFIDGTNEISLNLREVRDKAERNAIFQALSMADNNISKAADLLGVSRPTLYDLMKKLDISV